MTVLLTTHYMEEADELCDTVALMHRGRLAAAGSPARSRPPSARTPRSKTSSATTQASTSPTTREEGFRDVRRSRATARKLG